MFQLGQGPAIVGRRRRPRGAESALRVAVLVAILALLFPLVAVAGRPSTTDMDGDRLTNVFEQTRSHTDPRLADTDGNGIPDGAEDPDADGLTNTWEQALGLDPLSADTDGNGIPDGSEDADADQLTNAFEVHYGVTDPTSNDTDRDGLRDVAEDPDGDGLSNFGEQRFGTSPLLADTDGDGVSDSRADANHDGVSNGLEQDIRIVPADLVPPLALAMADTGPSYGDGCHDRLGSSVVNPCVYGNPQGRLTIALFGDSHAAQWLPALIEAARARPWRIVSLTHASCPSVQVDTEQKSASDAVACKTWRQGAVKWLRDNPPNLVLLANLGRYHLIDSTGRRISSANVDTTWQQGLEATLSQMPASSRLLVLGDTPVGNVDVRSCLRLHLDQISACETARSLAVNPGHDHAEELAAQHAGATYATLSGVVCSYDPCPIVVNELLMWRDQGHLTATYSRQLAPSLAAIIERVFPPQPQRR